MFAQWIKRACCMNTYRLKTIARHFIFMYMQTQLSFSRKLHRQDVCLRKNAHMSKIILLSLEGICCLVSRDRQLTVWRREPKKTRLNCSMWSGSQKVNDVFQHFPHLQTISTFQKFTAFPKPLEIQRKSHNYTIHPIVHQPCASTPPPRVGQAILVLWHFEEAPQSPQYHILMPDVSLTTTGYW